MLECCAAKWTDLMNDWGNADSEHFLFPFGWKFAFSVSLNVSFGFRVHASSDFALS